MDATSQHLFDTAVILAKTQAPTPFDHRQAELRGLVLCAACGKELTNVSYSFALLCGECEQKVGEQA